MDRSKNTALIPPGFGREKLAILGISKSISAARMRRTGGRCTPNGLVFTRRSLAAAMFTTWYNKKKGGEKTQLKYHMVTIEDLVPENHLLREVEAVLDLSFVREETAHLYSQKYGRPAIDPVVLVKYLLLGYLYGIPSERQIEERCRDSNAFRWYSNHD